MKLHRILIRDAVGLSGREIDLDLNSLEGLTVIYGPNGWGKTTLLELLQPYRRLPSRPSSLTRHFGPNGSKNLIFEIGNKIYKSQIFIDGTKNQQKCFLSVGGVDQKISTTAEYDHTISRLLGPPEIFFSTVFRPQLYRGFAGMTDAERTRYLGRLIGLEIYQQIHEIAKSECIRLQASIDASRIETLENQLENLKSEYYSLLVLEMPDDLEHRLVGLKERFREINDDKSKLRSEIEGLRERKKNIEKSIAELQTRERDLKEKKKTLISEYGDNKQKMDRKIEELRLRITRCLEAKRRMAEIKEYVEEYESIKKIAAQYDEEIGIYEKEKLEYGRRVMEIERHGGRIENLRQKIEMTAKNWRNNHQSEVASLERLLCDAMARSQLLSEVPCSNYPELQDICRVLEEARNSAQQAGKLREKIEFHRRKMQEDPPDIVTLREELWALENSPPAPPGKAPIRPEMPAELSRLEELRSYAEQYESLAGIAGEEESLRTLEREMVDRQIDNEERYKRSLREIDSELGGIDCDPLDAEITAIEDQTHNKWNQLSEIEDEILQLEEEIKKLEVEREKYLTLKMKQETLYHQCEEKKKEIEEENGRIGDAKINLYRNSLIQRAFSVREIPAYEIAASSARITDITNEMLGLLRDGRYSVRITTSRLDSRKKESIPCFDVLVSRHGHEPTELESLSRGEQIWIETAISLALTIYLQETGRIEGGVCWYDETDSALSEDAAEEYLEMLEVASGRMGIRQFFVVSHRPSVIRRAQNRIKFVGPGEIAIE